MRARHHPWLSLTIFCVVLANGLPAKAQSWLSDRKRAEGHGIRLGDFELHPGVGAEVGYTSNLFLADKDLASTAALRISPHLFLSTLGAERSASDEGPKPGWVSFTGGLSGTFNHFFDYPKTDAIGTDVAARMTVAPNRPFGLSIDEAFSRSALPFSDTTLPANELRDRKAADYTHYNETAGARVLLQSPGGLLKGSLGYRFGIAWFDDAGFRFNNNLTHAATLAASWEFLPKTALFYDGSYTFQNYYNNGEQVLSQASYTSLFDNQQVFSRIGFNGAITSRIGATIAVGYAAGFFKNKSDYDNFIGSVEGRYTPTDQSLIAVGVDRGFSSAYLGNFQERDLVYLRFRWLFGGTFLLSSKLGVEFLRFGADPQQQDRSRKDRRYSAELSGEYRFIDWLAVTGQFSALVDDTDFVFQTPTSLADPAKFTVIEGWLGLRAFY